MEPILSVKDLTISVDGRTILQGITFDVKPHESLVIIGANGAGKTLLIKTVMGFYRPTAGSYSWKKGIRIGYVPQKFTLDKKLPLTVREFLELKGRSSAGAMGKTLADVGLSQDFLDRSIGSLSGGQYQRALIAWALVDQPDVLIFDEPTVSIDVSGQAAIYQLIDALKKDKGITVFMVSHDLDVVYEHADKVICLAGREMICSADPRNALDQKKLEEVYGRNVSAYHH